MSLILIIEDEEEISSFLKFVFEEEDYLVETAASLAEARERLRLRRPDAVLLDRGLPDGDGLDLCRELKGLDGSGPTVMVLSARHDPEEVRLGLDAGADAYMTKPFQFVTVLEALRGLAAGA